MKNYVKDVRQKLELSQLELAKRCSVSRQTIYAIEVGKYTPSVTLALKLAKHLKVQVHKLFLLEKENEK